jgi:hypothetical protein
VTSGMRRTVTIGCRRDELLALWQAPDVRSRVFAHLADLSDDGSRWRPRDGHDAWEVELLQSDEDGGRRWQGHTDDGDHLGALSLSDAPNGFVTEVTISVDPVADAKLPSAFTSAALFEVLHRLKSLAETGEIPTLDRNPHAHHSGRDPH